MNSLPYKETFLVDQEGKRVGVILSMEDYQALLKRLEELEAFRAANEVDVMEQITRTSNFRDDSMPNFRRRANPGDLIVM